MIKQKRGLLSTLNHISIAGFFVFCLVAVLGTIGCSSSGGSSDNRTEYHLAGYDGVSDASASGEQSVVSSMGNTALKFYSPFPWFVNLTFQVFDEDMWGVADLKVEDFKVMEDGQEVSQIDSEMNIRKRDFLPSAYSYTIKTVLLLDNSPSTALNLDKMIEAAQVIVDNIDEKQQQKIAVVAYNEAGNFTVIRDFTSNISVLNESLINLEPSYGTTNFYGAVMDSLALFEDNHSPASTEFVQGFVVAITDGLDTSHLNDVDDAIAACDDKQIITVGVGDLSDQISNDLERLGNSGYYPVPNPNQDPDEAAGSKPEDENLCEWMLVIQNRMMAYADGFYWVQYKSTATSADTDLNHTVTLTVIDNRNEEIDHEVSGTFSSEKFFSGTTNIYFNADAADPDGIPEEVITIELGESDVTDTLTALTYTNGGNNPSEYEWSSGDEGVVTVEVDDRNSSKATVTVVAPGETKIIVTDTANDATRELPLRVEFKKYPYGIVTPAVQSAAPWFVDATFQVRLTYDEEDYDEDNPWLNHWNWVTDLIPEVFSILENKGTAEEKLVDLDDSEVDLRKRDDMPSGYTYTLKTVLLIDNSPSIGGFDLDLIKDAAKAFVHRAFVNNPMDDTDSGPLLSKQGGRQQEIAIWTFTEGGDSTTVWYDFGTFENDLAKAIDDIPQGYGATDFYGGMRDALNIWDNKQNPRGGNTALQQGVLVALTDGNHSLQGFNSREAVLGEIGDKQVITVGIGDDLASRANVNDLIAFGNAGYYTVPDPGENIEITIVSDQKSPKPWPKESEKTCTELEKTMMDIQDKIVDYADSFYWLNYKSYVIPASDCADRETVRISLNNNSATGSGSAIWGLFKSCEFFDGNDGAIYINFTPTNPWGEDGPINLTYFMLGAIPMTNPAFPMEAVTYNHENTPDYDWLSGNENIIKIDVDDSSYAHSRATLVLPQNKRPGSTQIRVIDRGNDVYKLLSVNVDRVLLPQPILYYPFSGNADDKTENRYDGEVHGATLTTDRFGNSNSAYAFDGKKDYIAISGLHFGDDPGAYSDHMDKITVCAWVKSSNSDDRQILLSFDRSEYFRFAFNNLLNYGSGIISQNVGWATTDISGGIDDMGTIKNYADGEWHFICATYDSTLGGGVDNKKIYVDGQLVASSEAHNGDPLGAGETRYGFVGVGSVADEFDGDKVFSTGTLGDSYFEGIMDEVMIFDSVLTQTQIKLLFEN